MICIFNRLFILTLKYFLLRQADQSSNTFDTVIPASNKLESGDNRVVRAETRERLSSSDGHKDNVRTTQLMEKKIDTIARFVSQY